jgi:hypothetical protein
MGEIVAIRPGVSKKIMRKATDDAHLHIEYFGDEVRMLSTKIFCIGHTIKPRYRTEFLRVLRYIQTELPMDETSIRSASICLDILREKFAA